MDLKANVRYNIIMHTKERKKIQLGAEERVAIWVSPKTRQKLNIEKAKGGHNNLDSLIRSLLD